ncbi:hypothetical protein OKA05_22535 [Luteolibacter arcticus]|uniref:Uncharacterized protein n=1 Tax=Luteolibacter arcticus TaxID=1581411 RepID=A0ABT3GPF4_9BACT|nr:hypothetical protein [Luteolibacter arcticus]MCW1925355.1 hypothetical protein [Luteolibacter arcticus]
MNMSAFRYLSLITFFVCGVCQADQNRHEVGRVELLVYDEVAEDFLSLDDAKKLNSQKNHVILEIIRSDEDSWAASVSNVWSLNDQNIEVLTITKGSAARRAPCLISGIPKNVAYASFFKFGREGLLDWVIVYEVAVKEQIECLWLTDGFWLCVLFDEGGEVVGEGKLFCHSEKSDKLLYDVMPSCSLQLVNDAKKLKDINVSLRKKASDSNNDDPFRKK